MIRRSIKWSFVIVFAICGTVLLVAEKTFAGICCVLSGLVLALPLQRLVARPRLRQWGRVVALAVLLAATVHGVAGTDVRPEQQITGVAAIDKVAAIIEDFRDVLTGGNGASEPGRGNNEITRETADKLTACMRDHGLADLPDPELDDDGLSYDFSHVNASQETIRAVQEACDHIIKGAQ
jgi:hypothetical protein